MVNKLGLHPNSIIFNREFIHNTSHIFHRNAGFELHHTLIMIILNRICKYFFQHLPHMYRASIHAGIPDIFCNIRSNRYFLSFPTCLCKCDHLCNDICHIKFFLHQHSWAVLQLTHLQCISKQLHQIIRFRRCLHTVCSHELYIFITPLAYIHHPYDII